MKETRVLSDADRTAGIAGAGYPIRAGKETFHLGRLTKEIRREYARIVREQAEADLKAMAGMATPDAFADMAKKHKDAVDAHAYDWGGAAVMTYTTTPDGLEMLAQMLLRHHHPDIDEETVAWLAALWSCPKCKWRGTRPAKAAYEKCGNCGTRTDREPEPAKEGENPYKGAVPPCCKKWDAARTEDVYLCACGCVLESVQDQITAGIRELASADPRTPPPGNGEGGSKHRHG